MISQNSKFILAFKFLAEFFRPFSFSLQTRQWWFFLHVLTDHDGGKQFRRRMQKNTVNIGWWRSYNHTYVYNKAYIFQKIFIKMSIAIYIGIFLSEILKKEHCYPLLEELTSALTPGRGFLTNFPTAGADEMTNARQMPGRGMGWACLELTELLQPAQISSWIFERKLKETCPNRSFISILLI